jgi:hypothetical protein
MSRPSRFLLPLCGVLAVLTLAMCWCASTRGQSGAALPEPAQLLDALEAAIRSIKSFDVYTTARHEFYFDEIDGPGGKRKLFDYPEPHVRLSATREVFSKGSRLIERIDPKTGATLTATGAYDGVERILHKRPLEAYIRRGPGPALEQGYDYLETYYSVLGAMSIVHIFRQRIGDMRVIRDGEVRYVILEAGPTTKLGTSHRDIGLRVHADTAHGFLPAVVERFVVRNGEWVYRSRMTVQERKTIAEGVEVPVKAVTEFFSAIKDFGRFQQVCSKVELTVNQGRSRWNEPVDEKTFRVPFPAGVFVTDTIRDAAYVTGKPEPGKNLADLAKNARGIIHNIRPVPLPASKTWVWWLTAGATAGVALLVLGWRRFTRKTI